MTKIKLCGLSRSCDIAAANKLNADYVGFVFAGESRRYVTWRQAENLKRMLSPQISAVGVFVNENPERVANLLNSGVIDIAQLHGNEDENFIRKIRLLTDKPIIKAVKIKTSEDILKAEQSSADYVLLDSGAGTGTVFDWSLIQSIKRQYFLAGGLDTKNVSNAVKLLHPFAVDVSSGIETDGIKDDKKMAAFVAAVRKEEQL